MLKANPDIRIALFELQILNFNWFETILRVILRSLTRNRNEMFSFNVSYEQLLKMQAKMKKNRSVKHNLRARSHSLVGKLKNLHKIHEKGGNSPEGEIESGHSTPRSHLSAPESLEEMEHLSMLPMRTPKHIFTFANIDRMEGSNSAEPSETRREQDTGGNDMDLEEQEVQTLPRGSIKGKDKQLSSTLKGVNLKFLKHIKSKLDTKNKHKLQRKSKKYVENKKIPLGHVTKLVDDENKTPLKRNKKKIKFPGNPNYSVKRKRKSTKKTKKSVKKAKSKSKLRTSKSKTKKSLKKPKSKLKKKKTKKPKKPKKENSQTVASVQRVKPKSEVMQVGGDQILLIGRENSKEIIRFLTSYNHLLLNSGSGLSYQINNAEHQLRMVDLEPLNTNMSAMLVSSEQLAKMQELQRAMQTTTQLTVQHPNTSEMLNLASIIRPEYIQTSEMKVQEYSRSQNEKLSRRSSEAKSNEKSFDLHDMEIKNYKKSNTVQVGPSYNYGNSLNRKNTVEPKQDKIKYAKFKKKLRKKKIFDLESQMGKIYMNQKVEFWGFGLTCRAQCCHSTCGILSRRTPAKTVN